MVNYSKNKLFNKLCWETEQIHVKEKKLEYFVIPYRKISSKWIKDLNVSP